MKLKIRNSKLNDGNITIKGYKHSLVQIIAASLATNQKTIIKNVPLVDDTFVLQKILQKMGCTFEISNNEVFLDTNYLTKSTIDAELSKKIHGSLYLLPALAARSLPFEYSGSGGCQIGEECGQRPYKHILEIMTHCGLGCSLSGKLYSFTPNVSSNTSIDIMNFSDSKEELIGERISSATKTALIMALTKKSFKIYNPYLKNDVQDLLAYISACGYKVFQDHNEVRVIQTNIRNDIVVFELSDCISEIISYTTLALLSNIKLNLLIKYPSRVAEMLSYEFDTLKKIGANIQLNENSVSVIPSDGIIACDITVDHKTIMSDHHPFFTLILSKADGVSSITEHVWKDRFKYTKELEKLGLQINRRDNTIQIYPSELQETSSFLNGLDTRATALMIIAAVNTPGTVEIRDADHLLRGYDSFIENIRSLGGNINVIEE